ncbi:MAG: phospholipase D family protein [Oligoflexales bacterium]
MEFLDSSVKVRKKIKELFSKSNKNRRRVIIVAYVGGESRHFLPYRKGIELYCWPQAGGTNPDEINRLIADGMKVKFVDRLHIKLYWVKGVGAIITSANLSNNALGESSLSECGVFDISIKEAQIQKMISRLSSRDVTPGELNKLRIKHNKFYRAYPKKPYEGASDKEKTSYLEWKKFGYTQAPWYLGYWCEPVQPCEEAEVEATERGVKSIHDFINLSTDSNWESKWFLTFKCTEDMKLHKQPEMSWLQVDKTFKVSKSSKNLSKGSFEEGYPYQAVQFKKLSPYCIPPFDCGSKEFVEAFRSAIEELGDEYFEGSPSKQNYRPANKLLNLIEKKMKAK